jgi:hypothetical protein
MPSPRRLKSSGKSGAQQHHEQRFDKNSDWLCAGLPTPHYKDETNR